MAPFKYQARNESKWAKRASGMLWEGFSLDDFQTFRVKEDNAIRILPPTWEDPSHYAMDIWLHYNVGPSKATVLCLYRMKGEKCPVCEAWSRAETQGRQDAQSLKPMRRVLVWILDRKEEQTDGAKTQPRLWAMPWTLDRDIAALCRDRQTGEIYQIDHPDAGYDVYFQLAKKGEYQEYVGLQLAKRPSQIDERYLNYIVEYPLQTTLQWRTYEQVDTLFVGGADVNEQENESTPAPPQSMRTDIPAPQPPTPVHAPQSVAPPPPPAPVFKSEWLDSYCAACGTRQYTTPDGHTCEQGHLNAAAKGNGNGHADPPPQPPAAPPSSRTQLLASRFKTGAK